MSLVREIHQLTLELSRLLQTQEHHENRDELLEQVNEMIEKRQNLINGMKPPYSAEDRILCEEIADLDKEINKRLNTELSLIKRDIGGLQKRKVTQRKYDNPYENVYSDGTFLDKRN